MCRLIQFSPRARAFTLVEVLTVIALITILASIVAGSIQGVKERMAISRTRAELACLAQGLDDFKRRYGDYPQTAVGSGTLDAAELLFGALTGASVSDGSIDITGGRAAFIDLSSLSRDGSRAGDTNAPASDAFVDPWGQRYHYSYTRTHPASSRYLLFSKGPNRSTTRSAITGNSSVSNSSDETNADDIVAGEMP